MSRPDGPGVPPPGARPVAPLAACALASYVLAACAPSTPIPYEGPSWQAWPEISAPERPRSSGDEVSGDATGGGAPGAEAAGGDASNDGGPSGRSDSAASWPVTGGDRGHTRYSPLTEIHAGNVANLEVAWSYRHGDVADGGFLPDREHKATAFEATPILVDGRLVFSTPFNRVIALHPETGAELWTFDSELDTGRRFANQMVSRGVTAWRSARPDDECSPRILLGTLDARLIALDARTGLPCRGFGREGEVDLLAGIEPLVDSWEYNVTSPPTVLRDRVIVGSSIADVTRRTQPPGVVRAFDVRTGELAWRFHTIPRPGEPGHGSWEGDGWRETGGANVWAPITADSARGVVYLPVSSPGPDFYGGDRPGANLFGNAVVALEVRTGRLLWHFQTTHHDLWDNDVGAPPVLVRTRHEGRLVDAVAVLTKTGFLYLLDRDTGEPLFPVEERPAPRDGVPGETPWPTQPVPAAPPPLVPRTMGPGDLWATDRGTLEACRERFATMAHDGPFTPPQTRETLLYPGNGGGANWSGGAFHPGRRVLVVPVTNRAHTIELEPLPPSNVTDTGGTVLRTSWSALRWLLTGRGTGLRYRMIRRAFSEDGEHPCHAPPWGALVALSLDDGRILWRTPIGRDEHGHEGLPVAGPPLVTGSGLVFQAGTRDPTLEVFDLDTGRRVAALELPAGLNAGVATYKLGPDRPQYLVAGVGGHAMLGSPLGDWIVAWRLPGAEKEGDDEAR